VRPLCLALPGNDALASALATRIDGEVGRLTVRSFPDGESYVRIESDVAGRETVLACTLARPDAKTLPLLLVAATARDLGAAHVGLVAPYLAYLRQDRRFAAGEGVTSAYFARILSASVDWLVTVDPHLHRRASLAEIYAIPTASLHAARLVAAWIRAHVDRPLVVGPDVESAQWVARVARDAEAPFVVFEKVRRGDREVEVGLSAVAGADGRTPVLVDDIVSTGHTMLAAMAELRRHGTAPPVVIGVHAVCADGAYEELLAAGPAAIVTTNTVPHPSNAIDVADLLAAGVRDMLSPHD
jgi:ribose-phosphate pyrophosphokinase